MIKITQFFLNCVFITFTFETSFAQFLIVKGTPDNDIIYGKDADEFIDGLAGADKIFGMKGNDRLIGGAGKDTLYGGSGNDRLEGGSQNDVLIDKIGENTAFGGSGIDRIEITPPADAEGIIVDGGPGGDGIYLYGVMDPAFDPTTSRAPAYILGGAGDDVFGVEGYQRKNNVIIDGGEGKNKIYFAPSTQENFDLLTKNIRNINVFLIYDAIDGLKIPDSLTKSGDTTEIYSYSPNSSTEIASSKRADGKPILIDASDETDGNLIFYSYRYLDDSQPADTTFIGGAGDDSYFGFLVADTFTGGPGNDYFDGSDGIDTFKLSGARSDYIVEEFGYNEFHISGPQGTDIVYNVERLDFSGETVDLIDKGVNITGDNSSETLGGTDEADFIDGAGGDDQLTMGGGNDKATGGNDDDIISGGDGKDELLGNSGADMLDGGRDADTLYGGSGNDLLIGAAAGDLLDGGPGSDTASYATSAAPVNVDLLNSTASGGDAAGDSWISIENLTGTSGNDTIKGNGKSNRIIGGLGKDTLSGRDGPDRFIYTSKLDSTPVAADIITDFRVRDGDILDFSAIDAKPSVTVNNAFTYIGQKSFSGKAGQLRFNRTKSRIEGDINGDKTADIVVRLAHVKSVPKSSIVP